MPAEEQLKILELDTQHINELVEQLRETQTQLFDISERMQVPLDYPAAFAVLALAGVVGRRAVIQPKARDSSWRIAPNLWGAHQQIPIAVSVARAVVPPG